MTELISDAERIALRGAHFPAGQFNPVVHEGMCRGCRVNEPWPCLTIRLLDRLDAKDREIEALHKEALALCVPVEEIHYTRQELRKLGDALTAIDAFKLDDIMPHASALQRVAEQALADATIYQSMKEGDDGTDRR